MALPFQNIVREGHFIGFWGGLNYPQDRGTRPVVAVAGQRARVHAHTPHSGALSSAQQRVACLWSAAWPAWQASAPLGLALVGSVAIFHTRSLPDQAARPGVSREKADRIPSRSFNMAVKRRYGPSLLGS